MVNFKIDIVSDTVCPWCYIGHKRLLSAISQFQSAHPTENHTFIITYHAYCLNPVAPSPSVPKPEYYASRFGPARVPAMQARLAQVGAEVGIRFSFGGKVGKTRDSHRLIEFGRTKGRQVAVVEALFEAYFEKEEDITELEVLVRLAVQVGLGEEEAREWLVTGKGGDVVDGEMERARSKGVSGVPNFTVNGGHTLSGAQEPARFVDVFEFYATD